MTHDTIFRIYSMTKPVTGVAMMILYKKVIGMCRLKVPARFTMFIKHLFPEPLEMGELQVGNQDL